jgi:hypothetical protein
MGGGGCRCGVIPGEERRASAGRSFVLCSYGAAGEQRFGGEVGMLDGWWRPWC